METQTRRRKVSPAKTSESKESQVAECQSGQTDSASAITYLFVLVLVVIIMSCIGVVVKLTPDHPVSIALLSHIDSTLTTLGLCQALYAVVLDAGSTGSRVLTFSFNKNPLTGNLVLEEELFHEVKPGLSSFAGNPGAGADTISSLLSLAQARIPQDKWSTVPVTLRATAGLRLLPAEQADALISAVQERMDLSGFDNRGVGMLSELDEGVFGWMTINYLMKQLHLPRKSYVALDLGGGSTQITFLPKYEKTFSYSPSSYLHPIKVFTTPHTIYSHSYLGLGLMAAREAIFKYNDPEGSTALTSPCMVTTTSTAWEFHGKNYTISPSTTLPGYEACMLEVQAVIDSLGVDQCEEVPTRKIAAFSYFHDRAVDAGLISPGQSGVVTVQQFLDSAQAACSQPATDSQAAFLCVDLSFIAGLLHHGYRLEAQALLGLYKQVNGYQTSWVLGAAFDIIG